MKNIIYLLLMITVISSCNSSEECYSDPNNKINFLFEKDDSVLIQSFVYVEDLAQMRDTVYVKIGTIGFVTDYDRAVSIRQLGKKGENSAIPGVHYIGFDDKEASNLLVLRAGNAIDSLPVILLRDVSLETEDAILNVTLVDNSCFSLGLEGETDKTVIFSDMMNEPSNWIHIESATNHLPRRLGDYGRIKHQFLISYTDEKWDYAFFELLKQDVIRDRFHYRVLATDWI